MNRQESLAFIESIAARVSGRFSVAPDGVVTIDCSITRATRWDLETVSRVWLSALIDDRWNAVDRSISLVLRGFVFPRDDPRELNCERWFRQHFTTAPRIYYVACECSRY